MSDLREYTSMKFTASALMAALPFFCLVQPVQADTDTVTVIGSRLESPETMPAAVTILTPEDWRTVASADLAGVLARQAGINLRSLYGNGAESSVDLRGYGMSAGQNTLFLLNGRRLSDLDLSSVDLAAIPLSRITRIEILRGTGGVLYGDGASAGVINIVTENDETAGTGGIVHAKVGSHDSHGIDASGRWAGDGTRLSLSGAGRHDGGYRDHNTLKEESGSAELQQDTATGRWLFRLDSSNQDLDLPGERRVDASVDQLADDRRGSATPNNYSKQRNTGAAAGYETRLSDRTRLILDTNLRRKHQQAFFDDYAFGGAYARYVETDLRSFGLTPRLQIEAAGHHDLGLDFSRSDYDSDRRQQKTTADVHRLSAERKSYALYDLSRFDLGPGQLSIGARWQQVRLNAKDRLNPNAPGADFESEAVPLDTTDHENSWQLGWRQDLSQHLTGYIQANRSVRFPTIDEIFQLGTDFSQEFSSLKPQIARTIDTGLRYRDERWNGSVSLFDTRLKDEIHFNPVDFRNINLDPTRRRGLEWSASWQASDALVLRAAGQWLKAEFRDGPFDGNDIPLVPKTTANLGFDWSLGDAWTLSSDIRHESRRRFDNDESNDFGHQIPSRTLVDARLAWNRDIWTVALAVTNLTDKTTYDYGVRSTFTDAYNAYPLPEREVMLNVEVRL